MSKTGTVLIDGREFPDDDITLWGRGLISTEEAKKRTVMTEADLYYEWYGTRHGPRRPSRPLGVGLLRKIAYNAFPAKIISSLKWKERDLIEFKIVESDEKEATLKVTRLEELGKLPSTSRRKNTSRREEPHGEA